MRRTVKRELTLGLCLLIAFVIWTIAVKTVDVAAIGPQGSEIGFATINGFFHDLTGVHMRLYTLTDWLGLVPVGVVLGFAMLGLLQWIRRRSIGKVDHDILLLGGFYVVVMALFVIFEVFPVNFRPVLIQGVLEASYPSSTTLLVMCVMSTAGLQLRKRISDPLVYGCVMVTIHAFAIFVVICRLLSGVHWLTDIIGGGLLSAGLVMAYAGLIDLDNA